MAALAHAMLPFFGAFMVFMGCICSIMAAISATDAMAVQGRGLRAIYWRDTAANLGAAVVAFALAALAFLPF